MFNLSPNARVRLWLRNAYTRSFCPSLTLTSFWTVVFLRRRNNKLRLCVSVRTLRLRNQIRQMKEDSDLRQAAGIRSMNSKTSLIVYGVWEVLIKAAIFGQVWKHVISYDTEVWIDMSRMKFRQPWRWVYTPDHCSISMRPCWKSSTLSFFNFKEIHWTLVKSGIKVSWVR